MARISVFVITKNEEARIKRCLESVSWADELVVVDSGSTDGTERACLEFTDRFIYNDWVNSNRQKQFALEQCSYDWVLSIDADEVVSLEMRRAIKELLSGKPSKVGYKVLRRNYYRERLVDFGVMHSKPELRLFRRDAGRFAPRAVHDKVVLDGPSGQIGGYLEHYNITSLSLWVEKNIRYGKVSAEDDFARGKRVTWRHFAALPSLFLRRYFLWKGILHGVLGFYFSAMPVFFRLHQYSIMWELQQNTKAKDSDGI